MELQTVGAEQLGQGLAVEIIEVDYAYLASESCNIADYLRSLGLADSKFIFRGVKMLYHLHESLYRKGVVLGGNAELLLYAALADVFLCQNVELSHYLSCVLDKLGTVIGKSNSPAAPVEYLYSYFLFKLLH